MSYQVLARKWRPQNFRQMVGQEHVLKALIHALESQRLHHAYLFTGTRGVGKTTIGRILAKCLSCEKGITPEPCGQCSACVGISEGRYVDLIEIDAASRTKVEDMRELLENVQYAPTEGTFKIYLIDEVHMLSASSFNALLKTLEEPPEHVKFLFATTDPQKLPITILSRCLQFNLKNMSPERIVSHLKNILAEESVEYEDAALWALARAADGSMRDALSLTDQAIAYGKHALSEQSVTAMLGTVDQKKIYRILDAMLAHDAAGMLAEVKAMSEFSPDYASVLAALLSILHRVAIEQMVPGATDNAMGDEEVVKSYAGRLTAEDVHLFYQLALQGRKDLAMSPDAAIGFEMVLLRMLAFQLDAPPADLQELASVSASAQGSLAEGEASVQVPEPLPHTEPAVASESAVLSEPLATAERPLEVPVSQVSPEDIPPADIPPLSVYEEDSIPADEVLPESAPVIDVPLVAEPESKKKTELSSVPSVESAVSVKSAPSEWSQLAPTLGVTGMTMNLLLNTVVEEDGSALKVYVETGHYRLLNESHQKRIDAALKAHFTDASQVEFIQGLAEHHETPMMWRERRAAEMLEMAKQSVQQDPNVQLLIDAFDAVIVENSIQAIGEL